MCGLAEGIRHQSRHVDRAQQAGTIGRQRLFTAGVCGGDGFDIVQVVGRVDPVDEDHAGFGEIIGAFHDLVPQIARLHRVIDLAVELQIPGRIGLDGLHEGIGDQNGQVEHAQPCSIGFRGDEGFDIRVVAAHRRHHRAAARSCRHDRAAHRIPHIHEGQGARSIGRHAQHIRAARPYRREIIADPATLLHRQRGLLEHVEDASHAVGDRSHDKAIEQRDTPPGAGPCRDAPGGQVFEILQCGIEPVFPCSAVLFDLRQ